MKRLCSGSFCNCLLPENIQVQAVRHVPDHPVYSGNSFHADHCNLVTLYTRNVLIFSHVTIRTDDDSDSASNASTESNGEDPNHRLLTTPNSDIAYLKDKPVKLAKELM